MESDPGLRIHGQGEFAFEAREATPVDPAGDRADGLAVEKDMVVEVIRIRRGGKGHRDAAIKHFADASPIGGEHEREAAWGSETQKRLAGALGFLDFHARAPFKRVDNSFSSNSFGTG